MTYDYWIKIQLSWIGIYKSCYHIVRAILSKPFCPCHFVQYQRSLKHATWNVNTHLRTLINSSHNTNIFHEDCSVLQTRRWSSFSFVLLYAEADIDTVSSAAESTLCCLVTTALIARCPIISTSDITCAAATSEFSENVIFRKSDFALWQLSRAMKTSAARKILQHTGRPISGS